jgi:hypothetical protein
MVTNYQALGASLVEWAINSKTEFLDANAETKELVELVKKRGIAYPNRNLAFFKTIYAELEVPNRNRVRLPKDAVIKGLPTMAGCQINFDHTGAHNICGFMLDSKIEDNFVVVYGALFKEAFKEEFKKVQSKFANKELFVSFEIHRYNAEGKDITSEMKDGTLRVDEITFSGCGLLLSERPACPKARVLNLLASDKIIAGADVTLTDGNETVNVMYAEMFMDKPECKKCEKCTCGKGDTNMGEIKEPEDVIIESSLELEDAEFITFDFENADEGSFAEDTVEAKKLKYSERQNLKDSDFALIQTVKNKKTGETRKIRRFPINDEAHVRNALARLPQAKGLSPEEKKVVEEKILRKAKALKMTDLLEKHKKASEEVIEAKKCKACSKEMPKDYAADTCEECLKAAVPAAEEEKKEVAAAIETTTVVNQESTETVKTVIDDAGVKTVTDEGSSTVTREITTPEGTKETMKEEVTRKVTYTIEEVEQMVDDLEASLEGAIPTQVSKRIKELLKDGKSFKEAAKTAWDEYKKAKASEDAVVVDAHKVEIEVKDKEIATLKTELEAKTQEIATLKAALIPPEKKADLVVAGNSEDKEEKEESALRTVVDYHADVKFNRNRKR